MSRSGYTEDCEDNWSLIMWRGRVASSIKGKRGQAFLRELLDALDAMPEKRLIANHLRVEGAVCTLGAIGAQRGVELESIDPYDHDRLAGVFNIASPLVQEIEWMNDEFDWNATPEKRWQNMRAWVAQQIRDSAAA